jgi:hypothetical protein
MLTRSRRRVFAGAAIFLITAGFASAQSAPNASQVLVYSTVRNLTVAPVLSPGAGLPGAANNTFARAGTFTMSNAMLGIYSVQAVNADLATGGVPFLNIVGNPGNYGQVTSELSSALNANIATALSTIPLASPASGVILKRDSTGAAVPASSTLGPVFTERAETVGKGRFYMGVTHQSFNFNSVEGKSLNGLRLFYGGGQNSTVVNGSTTPLKSYPATFDVGLNVRLSQSTVFMTYGVTNRFDVSIGLPTVHSAVAARSYNAQVYMGDGFGGTNTNNQKNCWCSGSLTPGEVTSSASQIGSSSYGSTGFGDVLLRFKGIARETSSGVFAFGTDLRLPTGDAANFHGIGTTAVKPFAAFSWFARPLSNKIVFAPHAYVGWQFAGKSQLGGSFVPSQLSTTATVTPLGGTPIQQTVKYLGAPFSSTKGYLPDVFSWTLGSEIAFGSRHTFVFDLLANQIGIVHGTPRLTESTQTNQLAAGSNTPVTVTGWDSTQKGSYGQYNGSFGYKAKLAGNLVLTLNGLVRFDSKGLTARFVPLYGLGYSF